MHNEFAVQLKMGDQCVHLRVTHDRIHCFKYNSRTCDFAVFDRDDYLEASDWIQEFLPTITYQVTVHGD